jgi:hypothetical protein
MISCKYYHVCGDYWNCLRCPERRVALLRLLKEVTKALREGGDLDGTILRRYSRQ